MNFEAYLNHLPYPRREDFRTTYWYKEGKLIATQAGPHEAPQYRVPNTDISSAVHEHVYDEAAFKAARANYGEETARLLDQFKQDLFSDLRIENHPKRDKLFSKAWELGHSAGYAEVYNYANDLVELIE